MAISGGEGVGPAEAAHPDVRALRSTARPAVEVRRNTPRDTWSWMWKDTLGRVVPMAAAAGIYACVSRVGRQGLGLQLASWRQDMLLGAAIGLPLAWVSSLYRGWVAPGYRLPTPADQALQTTFYLAINAPAEELFWRAMLQTLAIAGLRRLRLSGRIATLMGWLATTCVFGAYHRLGGWSWRAIAGVTAAGAVFGAMYLPWPWRRSPSILLPTLIHGFATAGFLSWGDVALYRRAQRQLRAS